MEPIVIPELNRVLSCFYDDPVHFDRILATFEGYVDGSYLWARYEAEPHRYSERRRATKHLTDLEAREYDFQRSMNKLSRQRPGSAKEQHFLKLDETWDKICGVLPPRWQKAHWNILTKLPANVQAVLRTVDRTCIADTVSLHVASLSLHGNVPKPRGPNAHPFEAYDWFERRHWHSDVTYVKRWLVDCAIFGDREMSPTIEANLHACAIHQPKMYRGYDTNIFDQLRDAPEWGNLRDLRSALVSLAAINDQAAQEGIFEITKEFSRMAIAIGEIWAYYAASPNDRPQGHFWFLGQRQLHLQMADSVQNPCSDVSLAVRNMLKCIPWAGSWDLLWEQARELSAEHSADAIWFMLYRFVVDTAISSETQGNEVVKDIILKRFDCAWVNGPMAAIPRNYRPRLFEEPILDLNFIQSQACDQWHRRLRNWLWLSRPDERPESTENIKKVFQPTPDVSTIKFAEPRDETCILCGNTYTSLPSPTSAENHANLATRILRGQGPPGFGGHCVTVLYCGHQFHLDCLKNWMKEKGFKGSEDWQCTICWHRYVANDLQTYPYTDKDDDPDRYDDLDQYMVANGLDDDIGPEAANRPVIDFVDEMYFLWPN